MSNEPSKTQHRYCGKTDLLDYMDPTIQALLDDNKWRDLDDYHKIGAAYGLVKDHIDFGYNRADNISASAVLEDGYGQCNTKGTLLMALLRALNVPCRLHGFTIYNQLQKGAIPSLFMPLAPKKILHSWVEVYYQDRWINLEGFILDSHYLASIQRRYSKTKGKFCGYAIATPCLSSPEVDWQGSDTYIQKDGICDDLGVFDTPDEFYAKHGTNLSGMKKWMYSLVLRHVINYNVKRLRNRAEKN